MRRVHALIGLLAILGSIWLLRVVHHAYTHHDHVDAFHLIIALCTAAVGTLLLRRAVVRPRA